MSDQHLVSPDSNNTESFIKITRIKVMMANQRSFDHKTNSPRQCQKKCMEKSKEKMDTDVMV